MRVNEAVESVRDALKLAPSEAAIYVHLYMGGPAKAGDLAGALKLHRNEVYRNATRLLHRGFIEMTMERPARYAALPPQRVFGDEIAARASSLDELRAARDKVTQLLDSLEAPPPEEPRSAYKVIQGRQEIVAAMAHMVAHARASVEWATTFPASVRLTDAAGGLDALARRVDAGVRLRAVVKTTPQGWALLKPITALPGSELRELEIESDIRFVIVDRHELLMWVVNDPSEAFKSKEEVAIQTTAPGFVQAEGVFFDQVWARAKPWG